MPDYFNALKASEDSTLIQPYGPQDLTDPFIVDYFDKKKLADAAKNDPNLLHPFINAAGYVSPNIKQSRLDAGFFTNAMKRYNLNSKTQDVYSNLEDSLLQLEFDKSKSIKDLLTEELNGKKRYSSFYEKLKRTTNAAINNLTNDTPLKQATRSVRELSDLARLAEDAPLTESVQSFISDLNIPKNTAFTDAIGEFLRAADKNPVGALSWIGQIALENAPLSAMTATITAGAQALSKRLPLAPAVALGVNAKLYYDAERYSVPLDVLKDEFDIDFQKPDALQKLLDNPQAIERARDAGIISGLVVGAIDAATGGLVHGAAGNFITRALEKSAKGRAATVAGKIAAEAAGGSLGEAAAQKLSGRESDPLSVIAEGLAEIPGGVVPVLPAVSRETYNAAKQSGIVKRNGIVNYLTSTRGKVAPQIETREKLTTFLDTLKNSDLVKKNPQLAKEWIKNLGDQVQDVYVNSKELNEFFQSGVLDEDDFFSNFEPEVKEAYKDALSVDGEVTLPISSYVTANFDENADNSLREIIKESPDALSTKELMRNKDTLDDGFNLINNDILSQQEALDDTESAENKIKDEVTNKALQSGRGQQEAESIGLIISSFYKSVASRLGKSIEEITAQIPVPEIVFKKKNELNKKEVDSFDRLLEELRGLKHVPDKRVSLFAFIRARGKIYDRDGELEARNLSTLIKKKAGSKTIFRDVLANPQNSPEGIALAAYEAGYFRNNTVGNLYRAALENGTPAPNLLDALYEEIDRENNGTPVYNEDPSSAYARYQELLAHAEELAKEGIYLRDMTNEEVKQALLKKKEYNSGLNGKILFGDEFGLGERAIITLFQDANLSTLLHETGHFFYESLIALSHENEEAKNLISDIHAWISANAEKVAKQSKKLSDGKKLTKEELQKFIDDDTSLSAEKNKEARRLIHENFSRAFEAYLMAGKSPTIRLKKVFQRFADWLTYIYRNISSLKVSFNDEIRQVFDKLLASDDELQAMREDNLQRPLFTTAEDAGMSDEEFKAYKKQEQRALDDEGQKVRQKALALLRKRNRKAESAAKKAALEEATRKVNRENAHVAFEHLANGRTFDAAGNPQTISSPVKLSRKILESTYGAGILKTLPRGSSTVFADDGMAPDEAAIFFGFQSGDALVSALESKPDRNKAIRALGDAIFREKFPELEQTPDQVAEVVDAALHGDERGKLLVHELRAIKKAADGSGGYWEGYRIYKERAKRMLAKLSVREASNVNKFRSQERKLGYEINKLFTKIRLAERELKDIGKNIKNEKSEAKKNNLTNKEKEKGSELNAMRFELMNLKEKQILLHALIGESQRIKYELERSERYVQNLTKKIVLTKQQLAQRKRQTTNIAGDYIAALEEILNKYIFNFTSEKQDNKQVDFSAYMGEKLSLILKKMESEERENELAISQRVIADILNIPAETAARIGRIPYKTLTWEDLQGVIDTLKNIEHIAGLKKRLKDAKRKRDLNIKVDSVRKALAENIPIANLSRTKGARPTGIVKMIHSAFNLIKTADTILREIDGFKDLGDAYRAIKEPIDKASLNLVVLRREAAEKLNKIYDRFSSDLKKEMMKERVYDFLPDNGAKGKAYTRWDLISIVLNLGNESSYLRMSQGNNPNSFTQEQLDKVVNELTKDELYFVQDCFDLINNFWPKIVEREQRLTGVTPKKVESRAIYSARHKLSIKGGYYPLDYDDELSAFVRDVEDLKDVRAGRFVKASTFQGHLKPRAEKTQYPIMIDIGVMHSHLNKMLQDLAMSEACTNTRRVIASLKQDFLDRGLKDELTALELWLNDITAGERRSADITSRWARTLRAGFTYSKLAFNLASALKQIGGLGQSVALIGRQNTLWAIKHMMSHGGRFDKSIQITSNRVSLLSELMKEREGTANSSIYDSLVTKPQFEQFTKFDDFRKNFLEKYGFYLVQKIQYYCVDLPTWLGAYHKAENDGLNESDRVAYADMVVKRSQGSGLFSDRSNFERGTINNAVAQSEFVRLFSVLSSYMFTKFNIAYERTKREDFSQIINNPNMILAYATDMALLFSFDVLIAGLVTGAAFGSGDDGEDEDSSVALDFSEYMVKETFFSMLSIMPFLRDVISSSRGYEAGSGYGSLVSTLGDPVRFLFKRGPFSESFLKASINEAGIFLCLPSSALNRVFSAADHFIFDDASVIDFALEASLGVKPDLRENNNDNK